MSMDLGGAKGGVKSDINVTPLVDVMLVLLIIMMLIAPMLQQGVSLRLPTATNTVDKPESADQTVIAIADNEEIYQNTQQETPDVSQIVVEYTADKKISVNKQDVTIGDLESKLHTIFEERKDKTMFISGAETLRYGDIMAVIDAARGAGVEKVGIVTA